MAIVRTYADEGKSGLNLSGREQLRQLLADVESEARDFEAVLVYDVSRWGRFQDADEAAYYEYKCRRAGVRVLYCAEPFENDGSPIGTIIKSVKRAMAGEYSRELSTKVFIGQCRLVELGFRQGGSAGYGLRRVVLDERGQRKAMLARGEQKSLQTDRVVLVPGPSEEVALLRRIYRHFVDDGWSERQIAATLNREGHRTDLDRPWTRGTVHQVLTNEKYVGNNVFNRSSFKLKQRRVRNSPDTWVRRDGAFDAIVNPALFARAAEIIAERSRRFTDEAMLTCLHRLLEEVGTLSGLIIDEQDDMASSSAYRHRFGSLLRAYALVGYQPRRDYRYIEINRKLRQLHPEVLRDVCGGLVAAGAVVFHNPETDLITVNDEFHLSVVIARCQFTQAGAHRWRIRLDAGLRPDITVAVRMDGINRRPLDYYVFPRLDVGDTRLRLAEENGLSLDIYRFDTLDPLYALGARATLQEVA